MKINIRTSLSVFYLVILSALPAQAASADGPFNNPTAAMPASRGVVTGGTIDSITPNKIRGSEMRTGKRMSLY